jgi:hypothetical protein
MFRTPGRILCSGTRPTPPDEGVVGDKEGLGVELAPGDVPDERGFEPRPVDIKSLLISRIESHLKREELSDFSPILIANPFEQKINGTKVTI